MRGFQRVARLVQLALLSLGIWCGNIAGAVAQTSMPTPHVEVSTDKTSYKLFEPIFVKVVTNQR